LTGWDLGGQPHSSPIQFKLLNHRNTLVVVTVASWFFALHGPAPGGIQIQFSAVITGHVIRLLGNIGTAGGR
jgi:hypothetical protein